MSKQRFATATEALSYIRSNGVSVDDKRISYTTGTVGLKVLGAIDYLVNKHQFFSRPQQ